jgi:hypothetical protein
MYVNRTVVGFAGPKRVGKSTCAQWLMQSGYVRLPFAGPLKDMLRAIGLSSRELDGDLKEVPCSLLCGKTPRHAMQTLGTEWRNMIDQHLWTRIWTDRALQERRVVADDVRFPHEVDAIRSLGGKVIRIHRPGFEATGEHASEALFDQLTYDGEIWNNSDELALQNRLGQILSHLFA